VSGRSIFDRTCASLVNASFVVLDRSALSGGVLEALDQVVSAPKSLLDYLATGLPAQSTFFTQVSRPS
jgi:hypothetical protein